MSTLGINLFPLSLWPFLFGFLVIASHPCWFE
jgi:hypothetical protein